MSKFDKTCVLAIFTLYTQIQVWALECHHCSRIPNVLECHTTLDCPPDEICFTEVTGTGNNALFTMGCRPSDLCVQPAEPNIVGRDVYDSPSTCNQCCSVPYCNKQLCSHATEVTPEGCEDNANFSCQLISSTFNICADIHHAKLVCKRFCGLCDLMDGGWGAWGEWSLCESTCGRSKKVRIRQCNDPAPAHGGLDCQGDSIDYVTCEFSPCPVAGGWADWTSWSSCSVSCGVGLQSRDRACSNPTPNYGGDHCFGNTNENRICFTRACADGGWSSWGAWSQCSSTCNGGLMSRYRSCDNPKPSLLGKQCMGNSAEYASCNINACPVPQTSSQRIFFSVNTPTGNLYEQHTPVFSKVVINAGNNYDISTGQFRVAVPGIYQFFVTFVTNNHTTQCFIRKNNSIIAYALTSAETDWKSASASTYVHCVIGDVIDLSCGGWEHVDHNASCMFSGALVSPDRRRNIK